MEVLKRRNNQRSNFNLDIRYGNRNQLGVTHRYQTGPESGTISYRSVHTRTERYDIVSFQFLVHFSVPPNFWTCFGTDRLIFFRTRVNATHLRTTFWNGPKWNGTISYPCEQGLSLVREE